MKAKSSKICLATSLKGWALTFGLYQLGGNERWEEKVEEEEEEEDVAYNGDEGLMQSLHGQMLDQGMTMPRVELDAAVATADWLIVGGGDGSCGDRCYALDVSVIFEV